MKQFSTFALALVMAGGAATGASAQAFGRLDDLRTNASVFVYSRPGEATTRVSVWGAVRQTGLFEVTEGTDLGGILSLAGGPVVPPRTEEVRQTTTVRLYRTEGTARRLVYAISLDSFMLAPQAPPVLREGDVVEVDLRQKRVRTWRDNLPLVTTATAALIAVLQVVTLAKQP